MSLEITPESLMREVEAARASCEKANALGSRMIGRFTTPAYGGNDGAPAPENYHYLFTLHTMARLTMGRIEPRFASKRRDASDRVRDLEDFCRRWVHDTNWEAESERCKLDMCFYGAGVAVFAQKPRRGYEQMDDPPMTPQGTRLAPGMFGYDALASSWEEVRFAYHIIIDFKNDLVKQAEEEKGWDVEAVKAMVESGTFANSLRQKPDYAISRKEVARYSVWVPGYELPPSDPFWKGMSTRERKKYHGTVFTLAACMDPMSGRPVPKFLRKPQGYFGPRQGPYCYAGFLAVPDQVRRLSPLVANDGQIEALNAQVRANDLLAIEAKTGYVMSATTPDANAQFLKFRHGEALVIPGFDKTKFERMEIGGPGPEALEREREQRARVARNLSIPDISAGQVTGTGTATENALAGQNMDMTADFLDRRALSIDEQMILRVAWCADQDDASVVETDEAVHLGGTTKQEKWSSVDRVQRAKIVAPDDAMAMKAQIEAQPDAEAEMSFDDLEIRIERIKADPQSRAKLVEAWNTVLQVAPLLPIVGQYAPGLPALMERTADELDVSELGTVFDQGAAVQVGQEQQEAAQQDTAQPRTMPAPKTNTPAGGGSGFQRVKPGAGKPGAGAAPQIKVASAAGAK